MEGESDSENWNPVLDGQPRIQTENLKEYKFIFAPRYEYPTRAEIKAANRCRKSGMVPGAFRKYLMQKKLAEEELELEAEGLLDHDLNSNSALGNSDINEDNSMDVEQPDQSLEEEDDVRIQATNSAKDKKHKFEAGSFDLVEMEQEAKWSRAKKRRHSSSANNSKEDSPNKFHLKKKYKRKPEVTPKKRRSTSSNHGEVLQPPGISAVVDDSVTRDADEFQQAALITGPHVRNLVFPTFPPYAVILDADNEKLLAFIRKNNWKSAIAEFNRSLEEKKFPTPDNLGSLIEKAILNLGTRVSRDIPTLAIEFFQNLVQGYPISCDESMDYYLSAFSSVHSSLPEFVFTVLSSVHSDAIAKVDPPALPFFRILTKMVVKQYKMYDRTPLKLKRPLLVRLLEEEGKVLSYNFSCERLLSYVFKLKDFTVEQKLVMRWVGLLAHHFKLNTHLDNHFHSLISEFVDQVSKAENQDCRISMVQSISDEHFGAAVCLKLIMKNVQFIRVGENGSEHRDKDVERFLKKVSRSELIGGLKSGLEIKRKCEDICAPILMRRVTKNVVKNDVNMKGEAYLHKLCRKEPTKRKRDKLGSDLTKFLKQKEFNVNPKDNFGNTPLHDAVAHERSDALTKFSEYCVDVSLPDVIRVDILAQNSAGETPFHLVAIAKNDAKKMVEILITIARKLEVLEEAKKVLNHGGYMPYQLALSPEMKALLKPDDVEELVYEFGNIKVDQASRENMQSIHVRSLIALWSEFTSNGD